MKAATKILTVLGAMAFSLQAMAEKPMYTVSPSNEEPLDEIPAGNIVITFQGYPEVVCYDPLLSIKLPTGGSMSCMVDNNAFGPTRIALEVKRTLKTPGYYTIEIPYLSIYGYPNCNESVAFDSFTITYQVKDPSGVDGVAAEQAYDIYRIDGTNIAIGADADALNQLPAGFYIVNGEMKYIK